MTKIKALSLLSTVVVAGFFSYFFFVNKPFYSEDSKRFELLAFEAEQKNFCSGGILFYGSSSIRFWKQSPTTSFENHNIEMVGFGGGKLNDLVYFFDRIVLPRKPKALFIYAGENDVGAGVWSTTILNELRTLLAQVDELNLGTQVYFMSIKPSPKRTDELSKQIKVNALIEKLAEQTDNLQFIDVSSALFKNGKLRSELFHKDGIHLSHAGYEVWTQLLAPTVNKIQTAACLN